MDAMWTIIVHGGAGNIPPGLEGVQRAGCLRAVEAGARRLAAGGSALDAACDAVRVLEDDPAFNAGTGAALDADGVPALDACVVRGSDLAYGGVGAVVGVKNAIDLARAVLEDGRHSLLVGASALRFARARAVALCDPELLVTEESRAAWRLHREAAGDGRGEGTAADLPSPGNTVGAVVRDGAGTVVAATSTGGLVLRVPGRVGDAPIAGAGTYARNDLGGLSATGHGETMMRTVFAYQTLLSLREAGLSADPGGLLERELEAARAVTGGQGGVIVVRPDGRPAYAKNTRGMSVAWQREGEPPSAAF